MIEAKKVAVYVDYFMSNIIEYLNSASRVKTIKSNFIPVEMEKMILIGEDYTRYKQPNEQQEYYLKLRNELLHYNCILLFGPTNAKIQLLNILKIGNKFSVTKIIIKNTEKLSDEQQIEFVNDCFYID